MPGKALPSGVKFCKGAGGAGASHRCQSRGRSWGWQRGWPAEVLPQSGAEAGEVRLPVLCGPGLSVQRTGRAPRLAELWAGALGVTHPSGHRCGGWAGRFISRQPLGLLWKQSHDENLREQREPSYPR